VGKERKWGIAYHEAKISVTCGPRGGKKGAGHAVWQKFERGSLLAERRRKHLRKQKKSSKLWQNVSQFRRSAAATKQRERGLGASFAQRKLAQPADKTPASRRGKAGRPCLGKDSERGSKKGIEKRGSFAGTGCASWVERRVCGKRQQRRCSMESLAKKEEGSKKKKKGETEGRSPAEPRITEISGGSSIVNDRGENACCFYFRSLATTNEGRKSTPPEGEHERQRR